MFFPLDLGARGSCSIGGNASTNAGGNKVIRYGMTRDLILGLEAVLADGTIISSMNKMLKNNTGYDLKQLFIGSEGTLGIITKLVLRLKEKPSSENTALIACDSFEKVKELFLSFPETKQEFIKTQSMISNIGSSTRIENAILTNKAQTIQEISNIIFKEINNFQTHTHDDQTLVILEI